MDLQRRQVTTPLLQQTDKSNQGHDAFSLYPLSVLGHQFEFDGSVNTRKEGTELL